MKSEKFMFFMNSRRQIIPGINYFKNQKKFLYRRSTISLSLLRFFFIFIKSESFIMEPSKISSFIFVFFSHRPTPIYLIADHPWIILYKNQLTRDGFNKISEKPFVFLHFSGNITGTSFF